ncbi:hypothetical protein [Nostoc sp. 'Peltigera membranacea cyanobiont' 210A]|uniref:hypothetical protein n=1 Tax=Nostoc sp. 'Peltigera membranacea cyanobiont' 210A TaxID=2014529 RepID=UPI00167E3F28|nr:hypothetical protein [Nostoc sp. 'Peltigera membranacea cyanobiont' 210A]
MYATVVVGGASLNLELGEGNFADVATDEDLERINRLGIFIYAGARLPDDA